ncbi:ABC transporter permease [Mucilaginibacter sp. RS28]|uniref:ABC transporter permease n=1 Tax=Mucilaginibacter straminoryzae TaxID=2932774 RepID=A0A9X1X5E2_9SPHI|nr:ABC transporter permease [Mucilaginibacter straminoryzae]MCJ8211253.1 ABC transporter permease [Mucilaginibacter straminoryzae]
MFRNYLKTAIRSLAKNKSFTLINVLGLALGLTACLLIVLYVIDELSYDRYNDKASRIYRVNEDLKLGGNRMQYAVCMPPLAKALTTDFPEVEDAVRIKNAGSMHVKKGTENIMEKSVAFADPSLFNVFTLPMINGNASNALAEPNSIVMTESAAIKYFNSTNVVGKPIIIDDKGGYKVTGVIKDIPQTSHFNFDFFISMSSFPDSRSDRWLRSDYNTYVLLKPGADPKRFEAKFPGLLRKYSSSQMQNELHISLDQFEKGGSFFKLNLIPLTDIHLKSSMIGELGANSTTEYIYIFSAIGLFILIIACVNFMNLSTARSANRAKEVGVRKVLGSSRGRLILQFLSESILITFAAVVIALTAALFLLPQFNQLSGKQIGFNSHTLIWLAPVSLFIIAVVGLLAGTYPAFFLSAFEPVHVLKGKLRTGLKGGGLRSFLVVLQFCISVFLIIGTLVVYNQLRYIQNRDLGYDRNQVLVIKNTYELNKQAATFKQQIKQLPGVIDATLSGFTPTSSGRRTSIFNKEASLTDQSKSIFPQSWYVDEDYIPTMGMKLKAGRNFSLQMGTDSTGLIINETAAKFLGFKDPIGKNLYQFDDPKFKKVVTYQIVGVIKDFNFSSLRQNISPVIFQLRQDAGLLSVRVKTKDIPALISQIKTMWHSLTPADFDYTFMDEEFAASYHKEQQTGTIFLIFTSLAIIIACLGLFGLAAYAAEQRTKEIGIRKVLGADVSTIVAMLSKDFIKLVFIAIVIAGPLAWFAMQKWLQGFAYRQAIPWWVVAVAGGGALVIAFMTISFQSVKAALTNPVESLKSE